MLLLLFLTAEIPILLYIYNPTFLRRERQSPFPVPLQPSLQQVRSKFQETPGMNDILACGRSLDDGAQHLCFNTVHHTEVVGDDVGKQK